MISASLVLCFIIPIGHRKEHIPHFLHLPGILSSEPVFLNWSKKIYRVPVNSRSQSDSDFQGSFNIFTFVRCVCCPRYSKYFLIYRILNVSVRLASAHFILQLCNPYVAIRKIKLINFTTLFFSTCSSDLSHLG